VRPRDLLADPLVLPVGALALALGASLAAPWLPLPSPEATQLDARLLPPGSGGHWLGTDALGRDVLSRLLHGLRASLAVSALGTAVAAGVGAAAGLVAGYRGGAVDDVLMRIADAILAFPYILLALALVAALGPGLRNAMLAVAVVNIPFFARTVRGATLGVRSREYVEVARLSGHGDLRIVAREVLPNVAPVLLVAMATTLGWMILETAGLSFLGLGAQPPRADLGSMLGDGRRFLATAPHLALVPGAVLFVVSLAVHALADGLRDRMDPHRAAPAEPEPEDLAAAEPARAGDGAAAPLLDVEALRIDIPGAGRVVDGIDLRVAAGEAVALVGESGSGKTVTALSLLGLPPAPGARVRAERMALADTDLAGLDAEGWRALRGRRLAYVPQDPGGALDPLLPVGAQVAEAVRAHGRVSRARARSRARELLAQVHLRDPDALLDARPHELSGGMRQRVLIAMAIAHDPDLLVADEPTTALDVTVQREILGLLAEACRQRRGLLLVTHDFGVVSALCDRVYVLHRGRIVEDGHVAQVLERPRHPYTRSLVASVPRMDDPERLLRRAGGGT